MTTAAKEKITHAAVMTVANYPLLGKSHADCFHQGFHTGIEMSRRARHQGFMTNFGRFVDREEGAKIAFLANQVPEETRVLCSEDLWSPRHFGKFKYDSVKGYHI